MIAIKCYSARHEWDDPVIAERCCHPDWNRESRDLQTVEELDKDGRVYCRAGFVFGWVRNTSKENK